MKVPPAPPKSGPEPVSDDDDATAYQDRHDSGGAVLSETERAELARLRKENSELKMDRAFLKKASLFFAQEASDTNEKRSH